MNHQQKKKKLQVNLNGTDKKNIKWKAREVRQQSDIKNYENLLTNSEVIKYFAQEKILSKDVIESRVERWIKIYEEGQPNGSLSIFDEYDNFVGYIVAGLGNGKGSSEIAYAFSPEYWNRGIAQSVLRKIIEEWGPEVRRIGLGIGLDLNNEHYQKIKEKFQCFEGKELSSFYATARPVNIPSSHILEKVGFEPAKRGVENINNPIDFNTRGFELPSLGDLFNYYSKIEYYIEKFHQEGDIEVDKLYHMIDSNSKLYTFSKKSDGRIRFHYEKEVLLGEWQYQSQIEQPSKS